MDRLFQTMEGIYILSIMGLSMLSFFNGKPSKLMGFLFLPMGVWMLKFHPETKYWAWGLIGISILYLLRGVKVEAYRSKSIWKGAGKEVIEKPGFAVIGKILCFAAAIGAAIITVSTGRKETPELIFRFIMAIIVSVMAYKVAYIVLVQMISPLVSVGVEVKQDIVRDVVWIHELMGRTSVRRLYLLFENDDRCFVTYHIYSQRLEELIGYRCEYRVNISILGCEFMMEPPRKISEEHRKPKRLKYEELKKEFHKDYSVTQKPSEGFVQRNRWAFISFFGAILLLGVTLLFLALFVK